MAWVAVVSAGVVNLFVNGSELVVRNMEDISVRRAVLNRYIQAQY